MLQSRRKLSDGLVGEEGAKPLGSTQDKDISPQLGSKTYLPADQVGFILWLCFFLFQYISYYYANWSFLSMRSEGRVFMVV